MLWISTFKYDILKALRLQLELLQPNMPRHKDASCVRMSDRLQHSWNEIPAHECEAADVMCLYIVNTRKNRN